MNSAWHSVHKAPVIKYPMEGVDKVEGLSKLASSPQTYEGSIGRRGIAAFGILTKMPARWIGCSGIFPPACIRHSEFSPLPSELQLAAHEE